MADDSVLNDVLNDISAGKFDPGKPNRQSTLLDDAVNDTAAASGQRNAVAVKRAQYAKPERYPEVKSLSEAFGVPPVFVDRNFDELKKQAEIKDLKDFLATTPDLAEWYSSDDNPDAIKFDELRHMSGLGWLWNSASQSLEAGMATSDLADVRYRQLLGMATDEEILKADGMSAAREPRTYGADGWLEKGWVSTFEMAPYMFNTLVGGVEGGLKGAITGAGMALVAGQAGPQIAAPEELITVPGAAATGYAVGSGVGQWQAAFRMEAGLAYDEFKGMRDENGMLIDDDVARAAAIVSGSSSALLEAYGFRKLAELVPGVDNLAGMLSKDGVKAALRQPTVRAALKGFTTSVLKAGLTEVSTEVGQEAIQIFAAEAAKAVENFNGAQFEGVDGREVSERLADVARQTAQAMTVMGPALGSTRLGMDISRARRSATDKAVIEALNAHAEGSELKTRLPEKARDAVTRLTANGPVTHLYIKPEAFQEFFQETGDVNEFMMRTGLSEEYAEAARTGRDIEIPIGVYYADIAGTEIGNALMGSTRLSQEAMTVDEADAFNEAWSTAQNSLLEEYQAAEAVDPSAMSASEQIFDDVKTKAMDAGIVPDQATQYAKLYSTFFSVMGERTGVDPSVIYGKYNLDIKRAFPKETSYSPVDSLNIDLAAIRSNGVDALSKKVQAANGPSLLQAIAERGGLRDPGGELKGMDFPSKLVIPERNAVANFFKGEDGSYNEAGPDAVARQLWEAGYFPEFGEERPTANDLFNAIGEELGGSPRYSMEYETARNSPDVRRAQGVVDLATMLDQLGLDVNTMSDEEIRAEIDRVTNEDPEAGALFQELADRAVAADRTDTPEFKAWFGDSKVVDENGDPMVVYHGSTADFASFDRERANPESDLGAGFYFSNEPADVDTNYAGEGPDLTIKIEREAERIASENDLEYDDPAVVAEAKQRLGVQHGGAVYPVYLSIKNPVALEQGGGTFIESGLTFNSAEYMDEARSQLEDEEGAGNFEDYEVEQRAEELAMENGDESVNGGIYGMLEAIGEMADEFDGIDVGALQESLADLAVEGAYAADLIAAMKESEGLMYVTDLERGDMVSSEVIRRAFEAVGFDGFIDKTVNQKFGSERKMGQAMVGMNEETVHFIAFQPEQVKSVMNSGSFDPRDARILYQDASPVPVTKEDVSSFEADLSDRLNLRSLSLFLSGENTLKLNMIAVNKGEQGNGAGSAAMTAITEFADTHGLRVVLTTGVKDDGFGTTSASRLKKFYKRFGFVENKGRNKDFSISENMIREPGRVYDQNDGKKRGSIQFGENKTVINMFEAADLSTFLHESGHFFLEVMRDMAATDQGAALSGDWDAIRNYLEIGDDGVVTTEAHEKWARTFEAYLFEGKAPSDAVAGIMARFRTWLLFVYRSVKSLNAPINDEIRRVMDRMIATDKEIEDAKTAPEFRPAFNSAEEAGMSEAQWKAYTERAAKAVDQARRDMDVRMMSEIARETTAEWRSAKKDIQGVVTKELTALPVYQAIEYLRTGKSDLIEKGAPRVYLDKKAIVDVMGEGALQKMPRATYRIKGGVHPDALAEIFGFKSGHDMLTKMMSVRPIKKAIIEETDLRMRQKYGDLMGDAVARSRQAEAAIANDATGELLQAELEVLMRKGLVATAINRDRAKQMARNMIRSKTIREAMRLKLYMNANSKAAADTEAAILKGDWKKAVEAKQRQLLNHYMAMEARQAEKDTEAAVKYLNRFAGRKRPANIDAEYLDQIDTMLERFDLRKSVSLTAAQKRLSLAAWIEAQEAAGAIVQIPDALRNDAFRKPYKEMTVDDLMAVRDAVKNIEHLGRLKDKLLSGKKRREYEATRDMIVASIEASQDKMKRSKMRNPTQGEKLVSNMRSLEAALLKIEQVIDWMDGDQANGPLRQNIWTPIAEAEFKENEMRAKYASKLFQIFDGLDKDRLSEKITFDNLGETYSRAEIMAVALNMGNASNLDKMMRGEAWSRPQLDNVISHLNKDEWQAVQKVWDTVNELWPEIAALQKRLTGVEPPKVEATPIETPYGVLPGGYYPVIYDPSRDLTVEARNEAKADALFENTYLRPETMHGFTKERAQAYARPILFDLDAAGTHIMAVIHDLTHREAIRDAYKLLNSPEVVSAIDERYGKEIRRQFVPWLQSIAHDNMRNDGLRGWEKLFRKARLNSSIMAMGYRFSTIITQIAGIPSTMEMVSPRYYAAAMKDFITHPFQMNELVNSLSGEMRSRNTQMDRDIRDVTREFSGKSGVLDKAREFAFYGIGIMDRVVTVPGWMGAYTEHLSKNPGDTEGAIAFADKAIRLTQGSGGAKDLAAVSRNNEGMRLLTMFYSYFSALYNRQRTLGRDIKRAVSDGDMSASPQLMARAFFMIVFPAILSELIVGRGPGDDESYEQWALKKVAMYPLMTVPIVRDVVSGMDSGFGYEYTPTARLYEIVMGRSIETVMDAASGELEARQAVKNAIDVTGYVTGLPLGQLSSTTNNVWRAIEEGDLSPRDFVLNRPRD
jgi:GNAT superfamily N-acetyltransferase